MKIYEDNASGKLSDERFVTNYKVFSRMFKAQFGMTPRELRRLRN